MNGVSRVLSFAASLVMAGSALGVVQTRVCVLSGQQEVPANASTAFGCGRFVVDTDANTMSYRIVVGNLSAAETAAHIHGVADPGVNAGVQHALPAGPVKIGIWNYPEALENDILAGRMYVNVHTAAFGGGEVRGQIVTHVAVLDGTQEPGGVVTAGRGFGLFTMNRATDTLSYYIAYNGLSSAETAAHIHGAQLHTVNVGVQHTLPSGSPKIGSWNYPAAMEEQIANGMMYVNVHTVNFGGGEIRGQIVSAVSIVDGVQDGNASTAVGCGLCAIDPATDRLSYDLMRTGFATAETAAHIHGFSPAGANSGVLVNLAAPGSARKSAIWSYPPANETQVLDGLTYFNMHTTAFPGGEIRGQILWGILPEPVVVTCIADVDDGSGTGTPDGGVTIDDLLYYISIFNAGSVSADVDDGSGTGTLDGGVTIDDLLYYLARFNSGC